MLIVLSPLFLVGIPLSLLYLFWLYRNRVKYVKQNVGTNFLFKKLSLVKQSKSNFKVPLRFFVDFLILSLFFLILANFLLKREVKNIEIVLDNSYSTKALIGNGNTRLEAIKNKAILEIEKDTNKTFSIYTTSPNFKLIENKVNFREAKRAVNSIKATNTKSIFDFSNLNYPTVIGDQKVDQSLNFKYYSVYKLPLSNVGILSATFKNGLNVKLFNFSKEKKAPFRLLLYDEFNGVKFNELMDFENESVLHKTINLDKSGEFTLKILPSGFDAISEDNKLNFNIEEKVNNVLVIGNRSLRELKLEGLLNYNFVNESFGKKKSFAIFDGVIPEKIELNSLINLPNKGSAFFNIKNTYQNIYLSSINNKSSITNYLNISDIKLNKSLVFERNSSVFPVVESEKGPVLIETTINDKKVIISGFDLFPFLKKKNLFNSVLTLNIFSELSQNKEKIFGLKLPLNEFDTSKIYNLNINDVKLNKSFFSISKSNLSRYFLNFLIVILLLDLVYLILKGLLTLIRSKRLA